jgi:cytochrome c biogenesis protein CcdA
MSAKTIAAIWFGLVASLIAIPFSIAHFLAGRDFDQGYTWLILFFEGVLPVAAAAFFGSSIGGAIWRERENTSLKRAFLLGVKIALASAAGWAISGIFLGKILDAVLHTSRLGGGILALAVFSIPITTPLAGLGAVVLRLLVTKKFVSPRDNREGSA